MGFLLTITFIFSLGQFPDFYRENIIITVKDSIAEVEGYYYLFNNNVDNTKIALAYPFPVNEDLKFPSVVSVFDKTHKNEIHYRKGKKVFHFRFLYPPWTPQLF